MQVPDVPQPVGERVEFVFPGGFGVFRIVDDVCEHWFAPGETGLNSTYDVLETPDGEVWVGTTARPADDDPCRDALPEAGMAPRDLLALLDAVASPATVACAGGRYFGFVTGGVLPAALAAGAALPRGLTAPAALLAGWSLFAGLGGALLIAKLRTIPNRDHPATEASMIRPAAGRLIKAVVSASLGL